MDDNNIFMKLHSLEDPGSLQDIQLDNTHSQIISQTLSQDIKLNESPIQWGYVIDTDSKLDIKLHESKPATITVIKIGGIEDLNPLNFTNHMSTNMNPMHHQVVIQDKMLVDQIQQQAAMSTTKMKEKPKKKYTPQISTNTPAVICQNCDGSFSTKYQFQRHQCEFNASKVILKSELPKRQIEKPKTKHECDVCHKSFMTDHNLDRHRLSHGDKKPFTCQNCGKGFVLESRLNTHIETHCKLSTTEPKRFYKTDLSVWQCWNCQLITATEPNHLIHICDLTNPTFISPKVIIPLQQNSTMNDEHSKIINTNNTFIFTTKQDENGIATTLYENTRMNVYHGNSLTGSTIDTSILSTQNNFDENFEKAINDGIVDTVSTTSSHESTDQQIYSKQDNNTKTTVLLPDKEEQSHTFKIISVEQLFQCEYCNRTYANKDILKEHQNSHGTDKNYQCMFCDDSFDSYTNALIHWQHKCDEKTNLFCLPKIIICKFCDKGFKSHELLYAHKYKLKHFVPKIFQDDKTIQINSTSLSHNNDYQQQNDDEFTTTFYDNSQHDDHNSHDADVKPNFNITYTDDNSNHHHHLYSEMQRSNELVNFDVNNNGGYVDTITITELIKKDNGQHLQLTVDDDTNNILHLNDVVNNFNTITKQLHNDDHVEDIHENISPLHDNCENDLTQIDEFLNDIANKVLNKSDVKKIDDDNNNNTTTYNNDDNLPTVITKDNNGDSNRILEATVQLDNIEYENDENSMRRKLRSSTRKNNNELFKYDTKLSLSDNKKTAKILSTTIIQNDNIIVNRVCTRNMERMKNKKEFNGDNENKIKSEVDNIEQFNEEDKENISDDDNKKMLKRKYNEQELFLQNDQQQSILIHDNNMQNDNDLIKNLPMVPVKRGRKPKPKLPPNEIVLLCSEGYRFQCEKCAKVTRSIDDLIEHRQSDHGSNFDCKDCGQVVHSAKALMIHCRAHQSLKPFVCDQCGRSYSQTSHLWQHMRFHQGIKPFACPHEGCEARYTIRPDLKDHIRKVHTRERPFRCAVCGKCFLTGSVYYQHRLIHNNDRRYGCDMCGKRFFRADALNNHRRIHTDERPFPCPVCGREFRQKGDRNKHHRTQHPTEIALSNSISLQSNNLM